MSMHYKHLRREIKPQRLNKNVCRVELCAGCHLFIAAHKLLLPPVFLREGRFRINADGGIPQPLDGFFKRKPVKLGFK